MAPRLTALRCLFILAQHRGIQISPELLSSPSTDDTTRLLLRLMKAVELSGKVLRKQKWEQIISLGSAYPILAMLKDESWVIIVGAIDIGGGNFSLAVLDPRNEGEGTTLVSREEFEELWGGRALLCKRVYRLDDASQPFGLRWFGNVLLPHAHYLRDMAILSVTLTAIAFTTPLMFNLIIDKVVAHHSYLTLWALVAVFTVIALFEGMFNYTRSILTMFLSNKADAHLASKTYEHVLSLPLPFFESMSTGVLVRNILQTEAIRAFLTGPLFQTLLDLSTMPLLLVGLMFYSFKLTGVVLLFSLAIAGVTASLIPVFRRKLDYLYSAEGARQADLVETVHGIRAVKSLALEPVRQKMWDSKVVAAIQCRASVFYVNTGGVTLVQILQKLMTIAILCVGVSEVFDGNMTIGGLVAFFMLSGNVSGPLIQVVSLINEYQQVALSVKMLGSVMNHPPERSPGQHGIHPAITGEVNFEGVTFTYNGASKPALDRVSFHIEEGQMIGVVGRSGSGKTTITRLIQGINVPQEGLIRLNGTDIRHIDLNHLRRNIGVVLQENLLFRGTLRDNIAATKPDAPLEEVMEAARLAGADEFIDRLPLSYETFVEEGATNFSGGQRQRVAIARALLSQPRLLIFDEATSALDPDSEAIIQQNLADLARGRTMVIVSHRLASLIAADVILVLERGEVVDFAPHSVLLERCDIYRHLWHQQNRHLQ
ncbi:MAG: peptidase domain-containing ABC transporter [Rhodospirillaceae bacterium]